jgi:hypothetical protein
MSEENVELVRTGMAAWNAFVGRGVNHEAFLRILHPELELVWHDQQEYLDVPQHLRGLDEFLAFVAEYREDWLDVRSELLDVPEERVLGLIRQSARGRQSGAAIEIHFFELWTLRAGKGD